MKPQVYIFIGKAGSGKGTQAALLVEHIKAHNQDVYYLEMGQSFRDFLRESNYTANEAQIIAQRGGLQPDFLANYFMTEEMVKYFNGERHFVIDGSPRTKRQARIVDGALRFYNVERPIVVHLDVSDDMVIERMGERGRSDDQIQAIRTRLAWFAEETVKALDFFRDHDDYYRVITLDGSQDIETVQSLLIEQLQLV